MALPLHVRAHVLTHVTVATKAVLWPPRLRLLIDYTAVGAGEVLVFHFRMNTLHHAMGAHSVLQNSIQFSEVVNVQYFVHFLTVLTPDGYCFGWFVDAHRSRIPMTVRMGAARTHLRRS